MSQIHVTCLVCVHKKLLPDQEGSQGNPKLVAYSLQEGSQANPKLVAFQACSFLLVCDNRHYQYHVSLQKVSTSYFLKKLITNESGMHASNSTTAPQHYSWMGWEILSRQLKMIQMDTTNKLSVDPLNQLKLSARTQGLTCWIC